MLFLVPLLQNLIEETKQTVKENTIDFVIILFDTNI